MKPNLQKLRKEAGFKSARAFAESVGIPVATYTDWEQGRRVPSLATCWELADALGEAMGRHVTLDELAGRPWPRSRDGTPAARLTPGERELVGAYRHANAQGRAAIDAVARASQGVEGDRGRQAG